MVFFGNLLIGLGTILSSVIFLLYWIFIIRAVVSWFSPDPRNPLVQFLTSVTEPLMAPVRRWIPPVGMFDLSIIVVIFALILLDFALAHSLIDYGRMWAGK